MFTASVTILKIFTVEMCMILTLAFRIVNERPYVTCYFMVIAMFAISVSVCEKITRKLRNALESNL